MFESRKRQGYGYLEEVGEKWIAKYEKGELKEKLNLNEIDISILEKTKKIREFLNGNL